jgi:hypothetical protein
MNLGQEKIIYQYQKRSFARGHRDGAVRYLGGAHLFKRSRPWRRGVCLLYSLETRESRLWCRLTPSKQSRMRGQRPWRWLCALCLHIGRVFVSCQVPQVAGRYSDSKFSTEVVRGVREVCRGPANSMASLSTRITQGPLKPSNLY